MLPPLLPKESIPAGSARLGSNLWLGFVVGPALAGGLMELWSPSVAIAVDAATFFVSAVLIAAVRATSGAPGESGQAPRDFKAQMAGGFSYAWGSASLRAIMLSGASLNLGGFVFLALMVPYASQDLGLSSGQIGLVRVATGVGGLLGTLVAARVVRRFGAGPTLVVASCFEAGAGFAWVVAGGPPWLALSIVCLGEVVLYAFVSVYGVGRSTLLVTLIEPHHRGSVSAAMTTVSQGAKPLGALLGGALGATIGLRPTIICGAVLVLICPLWTLWSPLRDRANDRLPLNDTADTFERLG